MLQPGQQFSPARGSARALEIAFALRSLSTIRFFQSSLELLVEKGHHVRLVLEGMNHGALEEAWLDRMLEHPNFVAEYPDGLRSELWQKRGVALRAAMEYVQSLEPDFAIRPRYLKKALYKEPHPVVQRIAALPLVRTPRGLRTLHAVLAAVERALPVPVEIAAYLEQVAPDVLVLGDFVSRGSLHSSFVRAARTKGIPVASCIASWDNLTTRPRMTAIPYRLVVWNETQRREAVELHGVPSERIVVTGAPNFDHWFRWQPRSREEFLERVGLDPERPVVLWVGGAVLPWERPEKELVSRWLAALRASDDPLLRDVGVIVRPHPYRLKAWEGADFSDFGSVVIWPPGRVAMPVHTQHKADYFDSIYHSAAVIGVNTTAMIEAAIVGRPVLTVLDADHRDSQVGSVHYSYLLEGGAVRAAESLAEHLGQLSAILRGDKTGEEAAERFVAQFVRPQGLSTPATALVVEALEDLAKARVSPERDPLLTAALQRLILLVMLPDTISRRKGSRRLVKRFRKDVKRVRRFGLRVLAVLRARVPTGR